RVLDAQEEGRLARVVLALDEVQALVQLEHGLAVPPEVLQPDAADHGPSASSAPGSAAAAPPRSSSARWRTRSRAGPLRLPILVRFSSLSRRNWAYSKSRPAASASAGLGASDDRARKKSSGAPAEGSFASLPSLGRASSPDM